MTKAEQYWTDFIKKNSGEAKSAYCGEISFGWNAQLSLELSLLVLSGKKTAACAAMESYVLDNEPLPKEGNTYVLVDWEENPMGIIRTKKVTVLPYSAVTWDMAQKEGEDSSMEEWRLSHDEAFEEDADLMGYDFTPEMPVVFEEFELIYRK